MAEEVRCPMCGKINPVDLEVCQYCQARLKPLHLDQSDESLDSGFDSEDSDDWLQSLRSGGDEESEQPSGTMREDQSELDDQQDDDWLGRLLGDEGQTEDEGFELPEEWEQVEQTGDEYTDRWLEVDEDTVEVPPTREVDAEAGGEHEDLAESFEGAAEADRVGEPEDDFALDSAELPDWLSGVGEADAQPDEQAPSAAQPIADTFEMEEGDYPDWMRDIAAGQESDPSEEDPGDLGLEDLELPEGLNEEGESSEIGEEGISWEDFSAATFGLEEGELPDWMDDVESSQQPAEEQEDRTELSGLAGEEELEESNLQTWDDEEVSGQHVYEPEETDEEEDPEWLRKVQAQHEADAVTEFESSTEPEDDEEFPDWLLEMQPASGVDEDGGLHNVPGEDDSPEEQDGEAPEDAAEPIYRAEYEGDEASSPDEGEPEWMKGLEDAGSEEVPEEYLSEVEQYATDEEPPEWLADIESSAPLESPVKSYPAPSEDEPFPDEGVGEEEIPGAELPSWLEAMRPVDTQDLYIGEDEPADAERTGPLAGLRGVLHPGTEVTPTETLPPYRVKLEVTERQEESADLLRRMIAEEDAPKSPPAQRMISSQHLLRVLIFVVLAFAVLWPILVEALGTAPPLPTMDTTTAGDYIGQLSTGSPVLVSFDYPPGWSGELDAAAVALLDHMMLRGAYFAFLSTIPEGALQAERVLSFVNDANSGDYLSGINYVNFGYVPAGPAGLRAFAEAPQELFQYSLDGWSPWGDDGVLASVSATRDFELAVVITESPERARLWIEQVKPYLGETPLIMVVSAQADPLVRPYYEAQPQMVDALVASVAGGASYEGLTGRPLTASGSWGAVSFGLLAAAALIVLGGLFNAAAGLFSSASEEQR